MFRGRGQGIFELDILWTGLCRVAKVAWERQNEMSCSIPLQLWNVDSSFGRKRLWRVLTGHSWVQSRCSIGRKRWTMKQFSKPNEITLQREVTWLWLVMHKVLCWESIWKELLKLCRRLSVGNLKPSLCTWKFLKCSWFSFADTKGEVFYCHCDDSIVKSFLDTKWSSTKSIYHMLHHKPQKKSWTLPVGPKEKG